MELQVGETWFGKEGTAYEGIQATIYDVTSRYVQVHFTPGLQLQQAVTYGKPLGKRQFKNYFTPQQQMTIFEV